jgi:hypothetical protein
MSIDCAVSRVDLPQAPPVVLTGADFSKVAGLRHTRELVRSGREWLKTKLSLEFVDTLDAVATEVLQERIGEGWDGAPPGSAFSIFSTSPALVPSTPRLASGRS